MVELIEPRDWVESEGLRREVFAFRHSVFVQTLNWDVTSHDGWEFDEYDALLPFYMIKRGPNGNLRAVWRLLPTSGPYMLRNTFPQLLDGWPAPASAADSRARPPRAPPRWRAAPILAPG